MRPEQPQQPRPAVFAAAHRQRGQVHHRVDGKRADRVGEGVGADELQCHQARSRVADPAQLRAEGVGEVLCPVGEAVGSLPGHQAHHYQVHRARRPHVDEDRHQDAAPVGRGEPGERHRGHPAAPVEPVPPAVPRRLDDVPDEPLRPQQVSQAQRQDGDGRQGNQARPADLEPGEDQQPRTRRRAAGAAARTRRCATPAGRTEPARSRSAESGRPATARLALRTDRGCRPGRAVARRLAA